MEKEKTNIKTNQREVAKDLFQEMLISHRDCLIQTLTGRHPLDEKIPMTPDQLVLNQERGLGLVLNAQLLLITFARPIIKTNVFKDWKDKYKEEVEQNAHPFLEQDNDFNELLAIQRVVDKARGKVTNAKRTKTLADDYIWYHEGGGGNEPYWYTTPNFDRAVKLIQDTYEAIFELLIKHIIDINTMKDNKNQLGSMF
jgi:hypothetical protein